MSKLTRFQKILALFISFFLLTGVFARIFGGNIISNLTYDSFTMLRYTMLDSPILAIQQYASDYSELWTLNEENDRLKKEISEQASLRAENEELLREKAELKELMGLKTSNEFKKVNAIVLQRDGDDWNNMITLNVGRGDGIMVEQAVVSSKGLVGKISSVSEFTSEVTLVSNEDKMNSVSIKVDIGDSNTSDGLLKEFDPQKGVFIIHLFNGNEEGVEVGATVITSGMGGTYPAGILIGTVAEIEDLNNTVGKKLYVQPATNFEGFQYVSVFVKAN